MDDTDFRRSDHVTDKRSENHHRPILRTPREPVGTWRFNPLAYDLGATDLDEQVNNERTRLENSSLAHELGIGDLGKVTPNYDSGTPQSMYPQLINQAARYAPMLQRLMQRGGTFATPLWKASQVEAPEVNAQPVPPQAPPTGPAPPISTSNYTPPQTPNERVSGGHSMFPLGMNPEFTNGNTPSPLDTAQWPAGPVGAPSASQGAMPPQGASTPMPQARPAEAPQADPMSFFRRNALMMQDPMSGQFIDPAGAAQAQASGPDLISKMMNYLHSKA